MPARARKDLVALCAAALLCALLGRADGAAAAPARADAGGLEAKLVERPRGSRRDRRRPAGRAANGSPSPKAKRRQAAAREERLTDLLAEGEERAAELSREGAPRRAASWRPRRRACGAPARRSPTRLVAIYESGTPSTAERDLRLRRLRGAGDPGRLPAARSRKPTAPWPSGSSRCATRSAARLRWSPTLRGRAVAYNERLAAARDGNRRGARSGPGRRRAAAGDRRQPRSLAGRRCKASIGEWVDEISRKPPKPRASEAEAEEEVGRWLGGPYSIPTYIVMCESGGDYGAAQPLQRRRRRLPDPALDLGTLRRPGRAAERPEGRTGPDRRRNLGRLRRQRLGLRLERPRRSRSSAKKSPELARKTLARSALVAICPAWHDRLAP